MIVDKNQSIINGSILSQIEDYIRANGSFTLKLVGFADEIGVNGYSFPSSFDYTEARKQLKKLKHKDSLSLLNSTYRKLGITELSPADLAQSIAAELEYWYLHITFEIPIPISLQTHGKTQTHNFIFFLTDREVADNGFQIMYSNNIFFNYTEEFDRAAHLNFDQLRLIDDKHQQTEILQLESVIYGICKTIVIEISVNLKSPVFERLIPKTPTLATFKSLVRMLVRDAYDESECLEDARKLQSCYKKGAEDYEMNGLAGSILDQYEMTYYSDWKFDTEDIAWAISGILEQDFTFEYPEDTYSQQLFPYIQSELAKQKLTMMNIDTFGDSYLFLIVNIADVDQILAISQSIDLQIEKI